VAADVADENALWRVKYEAKTKVRITVGKALFAQS
jgi:hypothetical protein